MLACIRLHRGIEVWGTAGSRSAGRIWERTGPDPLFRDATRSIAIENLRQKLTCVRMWQLGDVFWRT
jgi:hypothetical protein